MNLRKILNDCEFLIISDTNTSNGYSRIKNLLVEKLGINPDLISLCEAEMIKDNPSAGCNASHFKAMCHKLSKGKHLCVFEDDVEINPRFSNYILDREFMISEEISTIDAIYLGISSWSYDINSPTKASRFSLEREQALISPDIFSRVLNMLSAHAIIYMKDSYRNKLRESLGKITFPYKEPNDLANARSQKESNCIAIKTPLFYQSGEHEYCTLIQFEG